MDTFLTQQEKGQIQSNYETILENLKQDELILKFYQKGFISPKEKSDLKKATDNEKCQFIIDEVLFKATYNNLCKIRDTLINTGIAGHILIAKLLPKREEDIDSNCGYDGSRRRSDTLPFHMEGLKLSQERRGSSPILFTSAHPVQEETVLSSSYGSSPGPLSFGANLDVPDMYLPAGMPFSSSVGGKLKSFTNSFKKKKSSQSVPNIAGLGKYGVKPGNNEVTGKTMCVIIANFTEDLEGYEKDIESLVHLHKEVLKHEIVFEGEVQGHASLTNLTKDELFHVLSLVQGFLNNPMSGHTIDRFFLYILSHGDEDGIMTCAKGSAKDVEGTDPKTGQPLIDKATGKPVKIRTQMQEIVDMFTHEKVSSLKGFPKVFVNQSCRGNELLKAAGPGGDAVDNSQKDTWEPPKAKVAIGADTIVCEATSESNYAWVASSGSLYIQSFIRVVEDYHQTEHLYDMLVEVNDRIAHKVKRGISPSSNEIVPASQMPSITSKLTKKFYLTNPKANFY